MTDQATTPTATAAATAAPDPSEEVKALREQVKTLLNETKAAKAKAKEAEPLRAELDTLKSQQSKLAELFGAKAVEDPDKVRQSREAETRAKEARDLAIERATYRALLGKPLDAEAAELAVLRLQRSDVALEDGKLVGFDDALTTLLSSKLFASALATDGHAAQAKPEGSRMPPAASAKPSEAATKFSGLKNFTELQQMGLAAVMECAEKAPEVYARLKANHVQGASAPTRVIPPAAMR